MVVEELKSELQRMTKMLEQKSEDFHECQEAKNLLSVEIRDLEKAFDLSSHDNEELRNVVKLWQIKHVDLLFQVDLFLLYLLTHQVLQLYSIITFGYGVQLSVCLCPN